MKSGQHRRYQRNIPEDIMINPEEYYSVAMASSYLGKSRMSIYRYLASQSHAIKSRKIPGCFRQLIKGSDLIAFKEGGLPKVGRRRHTLSDVSSRNKEGTHSISSPSPNDISS